MGPYRKIYTRIWNDQKFNALSDDGKLACFLMFTHPHLMPIGGMRATLQGLAGELHWVSKRFENAFEEVAVKNMVKYDDEASFLWVPNFIKYNLPTSPNTVRGWVDYLDYLPECLLKEELIKKTASVVVASLSEAFQEALPDAFAKARVNQEQEKEQDQEKHTQSGEPDVACVKKVSVNLRYAHLSSDHLRGAAERISATHLLHKEVGKVGNDS